MLRASFTLLALALFLAPAWGRKPVFRPIPGEAPAAKPEPESLYTTPGGARPGSGRPAAAGAPAEPGAAPTAARPAADEPADETRYFEDLPGITVSGIPRVARDNHGTEIFFTNLNQSYFIRQDNFHNRRYFPFEAAMKTGATVSFRADPVSRQVLEVDGVDQASAKPKPKKQPASVPDTGGSTLIDKGNK